VVILAEQEIVRKTKNVPMKLGEWTRRASFIVVPLDDYEVVLGQEFMWMEKEVHILHVDFLALMSRLNPCLVHTINGNRGMNMSFLCLVDDQHPCLDIIGRGEEVAETNKSDDLEVSVDLEWHINKIEDILVDVVHGM